MTRIVLTEEQAKLLSLTEPVHVCDPKGHVLVVIPPELTLDELASIRRSSDSKGPRVSSEQVHQMLQALEEAEWQREGLSGKSGAEELSTGPGSTRWLMPYDLTDQEAEDDLTNVGSRPPTA